MYAEGTKVSVEKSRAEVDTLLGKHGATQRAIALDDVAGLAQIVFVVQGRKYRLDVPMPQPPDTDAVSNNPILDEKPRGWWRWDDEHRQRWITQQMEQARRERWRAIVLVFKAKFELVDIGISTIEKEFLGDMVLANGDTMNRAVGEAIKHSLETGKSPILALPEASHA